MVEIAFTSQGSHRPAADEVELDVLFTAPDGSEMRMPAFWAGRDAWKVRYASPLIGTHRYRTICSDECDAGLHGRTGRVEIEPYAGENPLYRRGPVRVADDRRHFEHADGTPFFWLGDTWWMGLTRRLHWPDEFQALAADRKAKGFTVVQIVAGLYPDMPPFDERGANEAGFPWTPGYGRIRPEYFDRADERILHLVEAGLVPCIVGAWHHHMPLMGAEKMKRHWREIIARWGALPAVWCLGGEINARTRPDRFRGDLQPVMSCEPEALRAAWTDAARYVKDTDPFDRPLGTHNVSSLHVLDDDALLDMYFMQTGHSGLSTLQCALAWFEAKTRADHRAPMVHAEANYQWLWAEGNFDDRLQRHQFWATMLAGAAGHTYGANGIWQVNRREQPFGNSPHGFNWGTTPWDVAMKHAASSQLGAGKRFLAALPWTRLVPTDNVRFIAPQLEPVGQTGAKWVWPAAPEPKMTLIGATFELPADTPVRRAALRLACDAPHGVTLNGRMIFRTNKLDYAEERPTARLFLAAGGYLRGGRNRIVIRIDQEAFASGHGLLAHLAIELADGTARDVVSDVSWRWRQPGVGWPGDVLVMDPSDWQAVRAVGPPERAGQAPAFAVLAAHGPRCAAADGKLWVVYVPAAVGVELSSLPAADRLELVRFDPRVGAREEAEAIETGPDGRWCCPPPDAAGDWVFVLRRPQGPCARP